MDSTQPLERILIRSTNWIGDAVMSMAALRELRRLFPRAQLSILAKGWVKGVYEGQGVVDEIIEIPPGSSSWSLAKQLRGFDRAILLQNAFEAALLTRLAGIPERVGYAVQGRGFLLTNKCTPRIKRLGRHQVYYYLDLLFQSGLSSTDYLSTDGVKPDITLRPTAAGRDQALSLLARRGVSPDNLIVGINPGAYFGPAKRWYSDRYAQVIDKLIQQLGAQVLIFGSASERRLAEEIDSHMQESPHILAGETNLATLIALISSCRLFITNDSGPMHLAAALNVPQLAVFGSTDEVATGPFSDQAKVIHKHVECSPCLLRKCPIDLRCFDRITVEEVFEAARKRLVA